MAFTSQGKKSLKKIVYITGCLGFIGVHVTRMCLDRGWHVIGVDKGTYASNFDFLDEFQKYDTFKFVHKDINDLDRLYDCDYIINTAAETHVDNSIMSSDVFLRSNINGVHHLLELIKEQPTHKQPVLLHFSTDEVYGDINEGVHTEKDLLKPSNPYSASKAAADMLVTAWARTYGIKYVIVRPTNNYGIGQYVEKLIPKSIKYLTLGKKIDLHDRGDPRRTWLHADDTASAVLTIIDSAVTNEIYNISGNVEIPNREVIKKILKYYPGIGTNQNWEDYIFHCNRVGQDVRYAIDDSKLKSLGWSPHADFDLALENIVKYYIENFVW
jgi:dTDP-glucose 4,6-dehydratase